MGRDKDGNRWGRSNWELDSWEQARANQAKQNQNNWNQSSGNSGSQPNQSNQTQDRWNQETRHQSNSYYYQRASSQPQVNQTNQANVWMEQPEQKKDPTAAIAIGIIAVAAVFILCVTVMILAINSKADKNTSDTNPHSSYNIESTVDGKVITLREEPESPFFKEAVEKMFGKAVEDVKASDYESIVSISITWENDYAALTYQQADGTEGKVYINDGDEEYADLQCFPNLKSVDIGRDEFGNEDLYGLSNLTTIYSGSSMYRLVDAVEYLGNITEIGMRGSFMSSSYEEVVNFPNVEKLYLDVESISELTSVAQLEHLKELTIVTDEYGSATDSTVFAELYQMTDLEVLSIDCEDLRDIGFLENMTKLREFTIINSEILDLEDILDRADTLEKLTVWHTYKVTDYSPVFELTNLTQLAVELTDDSEVPSLLAFKNLKLFAVGHAYGVDNVVTAKGLAELVLVNNYDGTEECIGQMDWLKKLSIMDESIYEDTIKSIASMQNLEELNLDGSYIWHDISCLFSMPSLKVLSMEEATVGMDFSKVSDCPSLEVLNMNYVRMEALVDDAWNYSSSEIIVKFAENPEFFSHIPNIRELRLAEHELTDVNFGENLKELEVIDITSSYVTDLTPLAGLENLQYVLCENAPIAKTAELDDKLIRDSEW